MTADPSSRDEPDQPPDDTIDSPPVFDDKGSPPRSGFSPPTGGPDSPRFSPGTLLADRYRIVAQLGRGGMGEVYRADDLTLGVSVALKFLPTAHERDAGARDRFRNEVRIAREVAHPNVCRMFDLADAGGGSFITMEYVDGEDLSASLRRIGRLPQDKAIEIARQLCGGVAAAHEKGVVHRDLKPANIMLDGRGTVRITDFGIAALGESNQEQGILVGTPAYMAPEQLAGEPATRRSDIYSLGLVLYEVFTGKPAIAGQTLHDVRNAHESGTVTPMSGFVEGLDPTVERVIMRCLEKDPARRPVSAFAVAAALPGGDPLAAALAAGETPSPEMVAAAGEEEGLLRPRFAAMLLGLLGLSLFWSPFHANSTSIVSLVELPKKPEVLEAEARQIVEELGYSTDGQDHVWGLNPDNGYLGYLRREREGPDRWEALLKAPPSAITFWYRQGSGTFRPILRNVFINPVSRGNPPFRPGMIDIVLDPHGRLLVFRAAPSHYTRISSEPEKGETENRKTVEWSNLFDRAGLDFRRFEESAEPPTHRRNFPFQSDVRRTWLGTLSAENPLAIQVEGGASGGRVNGFEVLYPWNLPSDRGSGTANRIMNQITSYLSIVVYCSLVLLGIRQLRLGRGDRKGATVVAIIVITNHMIWWLFAISRIPQATAGLIPDFLISLSASFYWGGLAWMFYIALEPYLRRRWPHRIISWALLIAGRWRDPLVGRDVLIGLAMGSALTVGGASIIQLAHGVLDLPGRVDSGALSPGIRFSIGRVFLMGLVSVTGVLVLMIFPILVQFLVRKLSLALIVTGVLIFLFLQVDSMGSGTHWAIAAAVGAVRAGVFLFLLLRFGLLVGAATLFVAMGLGFPGSSSLGAWYAQPLLTVIVMYAALGAFAFHISLAGRTLFRDQGES